MAKFKSVSGGHVRIIRQETPSIHLDIDEGGSYETSDKDEIRALKGSPEVEEVKAERKSESSKP